MDSPSHWPLVGTIFGFRCVIRKKRMITATAIQIMMTNLVAQTLFPIPGGKNSSTLGGHGTSAASGASSRLTRPSFRSRTHPLDDQVDRPGHADQHADHDAEVHRHVQPAVDQPTDQPPRADSGDEVAE